MSFTKNRMTSYRNRNFFLNWSPGDKLLEFYLKAEIITFLFSNCILRKFFQSWIYLNYSKFTKAFFSIHLYLVFALLTNDLCHSKKKNQYTIFLIITLWLLFQILFPYYTKCSDHIFHLIILFKSYNFLAQPI